MVKLWERLRGERGTMIPMYVLFAGIIIALITLIMDVTQVYIHRRGLQGIADGASLAAADGIDESALYSEGLDEQGRVELVATQAKTAIDDYVKIVNRGDTSTGGIRCNVGSVDGNRVQAICNSTAHFPIVNWLTSSAGLGASVEVEADSWADANIAG